jgi:N-acyl-D-glutamate deacylase
LNYGASAAWTYARINALEGKTPEPTLTWFQAAFSLSNWVNNVSTAEQQTQILAQVEQGLKEGGIGIGINSGYAPGYGYKEMLAVHQLAAKYQVPTYTHIRNFSNVDPNSSVQAYGEVISFATATGSHAHICHLNSTSARDISLAVEMIRAAQEMGAKVTVEAYPFSAASTVIGSAILAPENLPRMGMSVADIEYKGQPLTQERYLDLRQNSPGEPVVFHFLRLPRDQELLDESVLFPGGIIASDAMPWADTATNQEITGDIWPLPSTAFAHPRSTATYTTFLTQWVRDRQVESLMDAIARSSYQPAKLLEESTPQMKQKGRLQVGMDADIVAFDLDGMSVRATFTEPNQPSIGMRHVLVNGTPIISEGELNTTVFPGQPVRRSVQ